MEEPSETRLHLLVERARLGEESAVTELVRRSSHMATRYAYTILRDRSLAEEDAQEAMTRAVASLADLQAPEAFFTWLRSIIPGNATGSLDDDS